VGDGTLGWREKAPFNKIIVTAGAPSLPLPLIDQLLEKGKLVVPVGNSFSQTLKLFTKDEQGKVEEKSFGGCVFVPLIGKYGWEK
jgi:protein-L-isoaspartate(D-aspartate) O-methyltransferase